MSCDRLSVLVCWKPEQTVPIDVRIACLREVHPRAQIIAVPDDLGDDDTIGWAANTMRILGGSPDVVFTSEDYGEGYAAAMGAVHVMVDRERRAVPCSGTLVRANPLEHLAMLAPSMRAYYVKRVCVVGAESTGTTTLAEALAAHYRTNWVPEYGREYSIAKCPDGFVESWTSEEFLHIALEQSRREDEAARSANKVLVCDTDAFATGIWHRRYMHCRNLEVEAHARSRSYDLYLLTDDEIPFVQDGFRDGEIIRHWMHATFAEELAAAGRRWDLVTGKHEDRMAQAVALIDGLLAG